MGKTFGQSSVMFVTCARDWQGNTGCDFVIVTTVTGTSTASSYHTVLVRVTAVVHCDWSNRVRKRGVSDLGNPRNAYRLAELQNPAGRPDHDVDTDAGS